MLRDYWDIIDFPQLKKEKKEKEKKKREIPHTHTDMCTHKIFKD